MVMQFLGSVILLLSWFGLTDSFTLEGVMWFTIGLCMVAPHVVHDLLMETLNRVKRK